MPHLVQTPSELNMYLNIRKTQNKAHKANQELSHLIIHVSIINTISLSINHHGLEAEQVDKMSYQYHNFLFRTTKYKSCLQIKYSSNMFGYFYRSKIDNLQFKPDDALKGNDIHYSYINEICILLPGRNWLEVDKLTINMQSLYAIVRDPSTMLCRFQSILMSSHSF